MDEIERLTKERDAVLKRIQERQRMMDLIRNKHIKDTIDPVNTFQRIQSIQKIQRAFRNYLHRIDIKKRIESQREQSKYKFTSALQGKNFDFIMNVIRIQRKYRSYLLLKHIQKAKDFYLHRYRIETFAPLKFERGMEIKKEMTKNLKQAKVPPPEEYQRVINKYFDDYYSFCIDFPRQERLREDTHFRYHQIKDMITYMNDIKDKDEKFDKFMLDKNREVHIRKRVDKMEDAHKNKAWWYDCVDYDDFEETQLLDEIDLRYKFEKRDDILNKK